MSRWIGIGAVAVAAVVAVAVLADSTSSNGSANGSGDGALEFEEVTVRDLEEIATLDGTLGFPAGDPVTSRLKGTITDVAASSTANQSSTSRGRCRRSATSAAIRCC